MPWAEHGFYKLRTMADPELYTKSPLETDAAAIISCVYVHASVCCRQSVYIGRGSQSEKQCLSQALLQLFVY